MADEDDDIVCTGMNFGRSLDNDKNSVNANRSLAIWKVRSPNLVCSQSSRTGKVNGRPSNSTRSTGVGFESHTVTPGHSQSRIPKRCRINM